MRMQRSVFPLFCLLTWAACTSDAPDTDTSDSPTGVAPAGDAGPGSVGGGQPSTADGGAVLAAPAVDAGTPAAQSPRAEAGVPAPGDAGPGGAAPAPGDAAPLGACPSKYTTATHTRVDMSWPDTVGYRGGKGILQAWTKVTFTSTASGTTLESVPCGTALPVVTASPLLDEAQFFNEVPVRAFDQPSMPRFAGRAAWRDGTFVLDMGANVLGASLSDPNGPWPFRDALTLADHDGDGKPGVTAIARQDPPFALPPVDLLFTKYMDEIYTAARITFRLKAASEGCSGPVAGSVEPVVFDYAIVGCHVVDSGDCGASELNLLANQSPVFTLGSSGSWRSVPIAESASCADVRKALPAE